MTLSSSEADVIIRDLTDYNLVLKLYEARKGEIRTLESIRVKQDSIILNQARVIALNEKSVSESLRMLSEKETEIEKKDKKIARKNRAIVGLTALQLLEIGALILLIAI